MTLLNSSIFHLAREIGTERKRTLLQHSSGHSGNERGEANHRQRKKAKLDANHGAPCSEPRSWQAMDQEVRGTEVVIPTIHRAVPACEPRHWTALDNGLALWTFASAAPPRVRRSDY
jgi:hypothetical protein